MPSEPELQATLQDAAFRVERWLTGDAAAAALSAVAGDTERMTTGVPGVGLDLLMPDYGERMAGLARNVEDRRIGIVLAILTPMN